MTVIISGVGTAVPPFFNSQQEIAESVSYRLKLNPIQKRQLKAIYTASGIHKRHTVLNDFFTAINISDPTRNLQDHFPSTQKRMEFYKEHALPLSVEAIKDCVKTLNLNTTTNKALPNKVFNLNSITHLITVSCTGMYAPGLDIDIIRFFSLPTTISRTAINFMGCYGVFNAIKLAESICKSYPTSKVLIVSVEICSIHMQSELTLDHLISGALFSDGAGVLLMENTQNKNTQNKTWD